MSAFLTIRSNAGAADQVIAGALVPGSGTTSVFDDPSFLRRAQLSESLVELCTDDAFGLGMSTLTLVDKGGNDVDQGLVEHFLARLFERLPGKVKRGVSDSNIVYVGFTQTPGASETAFVWQIYAYDVEADSRSYADGDANFDNQWSDRENLVYP